MPTDNFKVEKSALKCAQNSLQWCAENLQVTLEFSVFLAQNSDHPNAITCMLYKFY